MLDTGIPSLDNNNAVADPVTEAAAIETDSPVPVKRDELLDDTTNPQDSPEVPPTSTDTTEEEQKAEDDADAEIGEDTQNPAAGGDGEDTIKDGEQLSGAEEPENVNENADSESKSEESVEEEKVDEEKPTPAVVDDDEKDDNVEINESIVVNQDAEDAAAVEELEELLNAEEVVAEAIVESVAEKLSIAVADEEAEAAAAPAPTEAEDDDEKADDEVEKIVSADDNVERDEDDSEGAAEQKPSNQEKHSLREDVSSSDDEDADGEDKPDGEEKEQSDTPKNEGLENEWGGLAAAADNDKNILTNEIDLYESVPIDLSNDIAINDIMADQGAPVNPDAEVFDVEELKAKQQRDVEESSRLEVLADTL